MVSSAHWRIKHDKWENKLDLSWELDAPVKVSGHVMERVCFTDELHHLSRVP